MKGISPQSRKAKGRRLQKEVRDNLRAIGKLYGLVNEDIESRGMGQSGVDVILSPAAQKVFNLLIECKNVESLNVSTTFQEHFDKYNGSSGLILLIHRKNSTQSLVTLRWDTFLAVVERLLIGEKNATRTGAEVTA